MPPHFRSILLIAGALAVVYGQPSPEVQKRISAAIKAAANATTIDYTTFVNPFVGTGKISALSMQ